jgi:cation transport regulator ChaC
VIEPPLAVFAYGSLMAEPEWPEVLIRSEPASLPGYRRAFNKRSWARGCNTDNQRWPGLEISGTFFDGDRCLSLSMGTEPNPGGALEGAVLYYPSWCAERVRARMDLREGYYPNRPEESGYEPTEVTLALREGACNALVYLTNPDSQWYQGTLSLEETAQLLLHATPLRSRRARGIDYLLSVRKALAEDGRADPYLEDLARTLRGMDGPWQSWIPED